MQENTSKYVKQFYSIEGVAITDETLIQLIENRKDISIFQLSLVIRAIQKEINDGLYDLRK